MSLWSLRVATRIGRTMHGHPMPRQFSAQSDGIRKRLKDDLKTAMKSKNALQAKVIRSVISDALNAEKANPDRFNENMILPIIRKAIGQRNDSASQYEAAGRSDLAKAEIEERDLLAVYMPAQLTEADIDSRLKVILDGGELGPKPTLGQVIKAFYAHVEKTSVDGTAVTSQAKSLMGL